jgi:hypothetical protein
MFSPRRIVFWLSVVLQSVNALNAAGPYELVYLYYAYKMEYATVAAGSRKIAPGCVHTPFAGNAAAPLGVIDAANTAAAVTQGVVGICTFYEFWHQVGTNAWAQAMNGKELPRRNDPLSITNPLTRTLNPDADRFADSVNDPATIGARRLATLPDVLWSPAELALMGGAGNAAWATQLQRASTVVEAAREEMANRLLADV